MHLDQPLEFRKRKRRKSSVSLFFTRDKPSTGEKGHSEEGVGTNNPLRKTAKPKEKKKDNHQSLVFTLDKPSTGERGQSEDSAWTVNIRKT